MELTAAGRRRLGAARGHTGPVEWVRRGAAVIGGLLLLWLLLRVLLWRARPDELGAREALRLLPDVVRLVRRLAADRCLPRGVRMRLWRCSPTSSRRIDLVPDFLPVIGTRTTSSSWRGRCARWCGGQGARPWHGTGPATRPAWRSSSRLAGVHTRDVMMALALTP